MLTFNFYGGVGEIGGNKFLLEDGETRLFLDFGTPFGLRYRYYEEYLKPRSGLGLLDPLKMGLLPPLGGLYREDLIPGKGFYQHFEAHPRYREVAVAGVLLSHAHLDHSGYISFLRGDIPIYCTAMTAFIAKAIQDSGPSDFEREVCYYTPREQAFPKLVTGTDNLGALQSGNYRKVPAQQRPFILCDGESLDDAALDFWSDTPGARELHTCPPGMGSGSFGGLNIRHFPVDHSIFGASAFALETSQGWIVYTGDLRFHGGKAQLTEQFLHAAAQLQPAVLLSEGTNYNPDALEESGPTTEEEVFSNALRAIRGAEGSLVIADFGPRNVERLLTFRQIARDTQRRLVVLAKDVYLLKVMQLVSPEIPDIAADPLIAIYHDNKANLLKWEKVIRERYSSKLVTPDDVRLEQGDYILCFSFFDLNELPSILPREGSLYLYSSSEAHNEEQEMDIKRLHNWLDHFGMRHVGLPVEVAPGRWETPEGEKGLHASGHASGPELLRLIREINPQVLVPIHTENPDRFAQHLPGIKVRPPTLGQAMSFRR